MYGNAGNFIVDFQYILKVTKNADVYVGLLEHAFCKLLEAAVDDQMFVIMIILAVTNQKFQSND